ncbi:hypothetical protein NQ314_008726 [Rhamnusium bicolor]|uniref:KAP NTPase domain-containing protein n=1 Tax=Rhamnusium bicolor TaxID=1586634 RepID=A0AAV8Y709_9CUCU|nr:hypothetical protein NQ314_008726 [Rhamnusium bicolor]
MKYGLHIASVILHRCSSMKIVEILSHNQVLLQPNQVKVLFDKDPNVLKFYLNHHKNITGCSYPEKNVFKYIALKNPQILLELEKEEKLSTQSLGRRLSKKNNKTYK